MGRRWRLNSPQNSFAGRVFVLKVFNLAQKSAAAIHTRQGLQNERRRLRRENAR